MTYRTGQHGYFARNRRIFSGLLSAKAAYVYKSVFDDDESDTQEVELELEYETPWVTPSPAVVSRLSSEPEPDAMLDISARL